MTAASGVTEDASKSRQILSHRRGRLKVFLGMAPGVGKTRAMLEAAQKERLAGRDVVIGCLLDESLARTSPLTKNLPTVTSQENTSSLAAGVLDVAALLARRPDVAVVDELARSNAATGAFPHRYQEVRTLLEAGIDVFTTLNIAQVASRTDEVRNITGAVSDETVPDSILDTSELELVDVTPRELLRRTSRGETRLASAQGARAVFLDEGRLVALRELTVRLFAERASLEATRFLAQAGPSHAARPGQRLLAIVRDDEESEPVIRWTRRMADNFHCPWTVLHVEDPRFTRGAGNSQAAKVIAFARELGAEVVSTAEADPVAATLRVAAQRHITQVILGKPGERNAQGLFQRRSFAEAFLRKAQNLGVQVVPVGVKPALPLPPHARVGDGAALRQYLTAIGVILAVTLAAFAFTPLVGPHATALVFLLTVLLLALFVPRGPTLLAASLSAVSWVYFFLPPEFAFQIQHFEDAMLTAMYIIVALVTGHLATRIREQKDAERERENRATALYLVTRDLNEAASLDQMIQRVVGQLESAFHASVAMYITGETGALHLHEHSTFQPPKNERDIPAWVAQHRQRAGSFTSEFSFASALYLPLVTPAGGAGVLGLRLQQSRELAGLQDNLLDAFCQQIAMALDRHRLNTLSEKAKLLAESERLSKTLLDCVSHEIRTPIAAITSATGNLAELLDSDTHMRQAMISEIQEATARLNRLVGNVIDASRLESGAVVPRFNECDAGELIHVALSDVEKELSGHKVTVRIQPGLPVVPMDFVLMQQALVNLLSNAAQHTPPGTAVEISARTAGDRLLLWVADRGPGIPAESLPRIFDKFYRVSNSRTGGTGLGLSLVKGFVEAQHGRISAENRPGGGVAFTIAMPRKTAAAPADPHA